MLVASRLTLGLQLTADHGRDARVLRTAMRVLTESRVEPSERPIDLSDKTALELSNRRDGLGAQGLSSYRVQESFKIRPDDGDAPFAKNPPNVPSIVVDRTLQRCASVVYEP